MKIEMYIVCFYNRLAGTEFDSIQDLPPEAVDFLSAYSYQEIIKPFVVEDLLGGMSREGVAIKYQVKPHFARVIGRELGLFKKKDRSLRTG